MKISLLDSKLLRKLYLLFYVFSGTFEESLNDANIDDDAKDNEEHRPSFPVMVKTCKKKFTISLIFLL